MNFCDDADKSWIKVIAYACIEGAGVVLPVAV